MLWKRVISFFENDSIKILVSLFAKPIALIVLLHLCFFIIIPVVQCQCKSFVNSYSRFPGGDYYYESDNGRSYKKTLKPEKIEEVAFIESALFLQRGEVLKKGENWYRHEDPDLFLNWIFKGYLYVILFVLFIGDLYIKFTKKLNSISQEQIGCNFLLFIPFLNIYKYSKIEHIFTGIIPYNKTLNKDTFFSKIGKYCTFSIFILGQYIIISYILYYIISLPWEFPSIWFICIILLVMSVFSCINIYNKIKCIFLVRKFAIKK